MRKLIIVALAAILAISCTTEQYKITGEIEDALDQMVFLKKMDGNELVTVESTQMADGKFTFTGKVDVPDIHALDFEHQEDRIVLFLENSKINITGHVDNIMLSEVSGSATHDLLMEFNQLQEEISQPLMEINFRYQSAAMEGSLTPELENELRNEYMAENEKISKTLKGFVLENNHSVVSAYITISQLANSLTSEELEEIVSKFPDNIQSSPFVEALNEKLEVEKLTAVGQQYLDFTQPDPNGNPVTFSSFIGEKYVLLDFWAGWCTPCRHENPHLVNMYSQFKDKGFEIFGVSLDRREQEWLDAIEADGLTWPQVSDIAGWENPVARMYGIQSIPANLLISPDGTIIAKNLRGEKLEEKLVEIFN